MIGCVLLCCLGLLYAAPGTDEAASKLRLEKTVENFGLIALLTNFLPGVLVVLRRRFSCLRLEWEMVRL